MLNDFFDIFIGEFWRLIIEWGLFEQFWQLCSVGIGGFVAVGDGKGLFMDALHV